MTRESTACGKDVDQHVAAFAPYSDAGFDEIFIANMGTGSAVALDMA